MTAEELANIDTLIKAARGISDAELELAIALKDGIKATTLAPYFEELRSKSQELSTAIVLLCGGHTYNLGNDAEQATFFSKIRVQHVSDAKTYVDRVKGSLADMMQTKHPDYPPISIGPVRQRLGEAYGAIIHDFNFRLPFDGAIPTTVVRPHGDYPHVLHRLLFALKYWRDWLGFAIKVLPNSPTQPWADAVIQYCNGANCIHRIMSMVAGNVYLPIEADPFERSGRVIKLLGFDVQKRLKDCTEHWADVGLRSVAFKEGSKKLADAWFHVGLDWNKLMQMVNSKKFQFDWEVLEF